MLDTSTVRLVILLGMFLVFAGDHGTLITSLWSSGTEGNRTEALKKMPEGPPKKGPHLDWMVYAATQKSLETENAITRRAKMMTTIKTACLPKLICELSSVAHQNQLSEMERSLLNLIRDTTLDNVAEVASKYHYAAHMGQLISGIEGQGCQNFYPTCPLSGANILKMMKKIRPH